MTRPMDERIADRERQTQHDIDDARAHLAATEEASEP